MKENKRIRWFDGSKLGAAAAAVTLAAAPALAAGPYSVRRAESASAVAGSNPIAIVTNGPFDDDPTRLSDGLSYFYTASDASDAPIAVSVHADRATGLLRIGFDDGNAASAPVSAALSTVAVAPPAIPADGLTTSIVTIVPRDSDGAPLGAGLAVSIAPAALWPGRVMGSVEDLADGRYSARVASPFQGIGTVAVTVEGLVLAQEPQIVFEPFAESGSLRDIAIRRLADLTGPFGPFQDSLANSEAMIWAQRALQELVGGGPARDDNAIKPDIENAVESLLAMIATSPDAPIEATWLVDDLVEIARLIALHHLNLATASCGPCNASSWSPVKVCAAQNFLTQGDALRATFGPALVESVHQYGLSVEQSRQAQIRCR